MIITAQKTKGISPPNPKINDSLGNFNFLKSLYFNK